MTFPTIRDSASHTSSANETFRAVMPTDVGEEDALVVHYAGDGNLASLQVLTGDFVGWHLVNSRVVSGTLVAGVLTKIADGTEGGDTLIAATSPSEKWCVSAVALDDVDLYRSFGFLSTSNTGSANPDQGAIANTDGDILYLTALAGEGAAATTASPAGYTTEHTLNNGAADGASLRVAHKASNTVPENPGAWTRASTAWNAHIMSTRGTEVGAPKHQRLVARKTEILFGTTKDYAVTVGAGPARRFFALFHGASSTVSTITLDPGGPAEAELIPVVDDAATAAETTAPGTARAATWYEVFPVPPPGAYTLRVQTSISDACALQSVTMLNSEQKAGAHHVLNAAGSGAAASGNLNIPEFGMVMVGAVQPMSSQVDGFTWNSFTGRPQQSSWTAPHFCTMFAQRVRSASPLAITVEASGTGSVQAFSAFSVRYADESPNPLFFCGLREPN